jgi:hypothetical protein
MAGWPRCAETDGGTASCEAVAAPARRSGGVTHMFGRVTDTARKLLDHLQAACDALARATDDSAGSHFDAAAYQRGKTQLQGVIGELDAVTP